ncbi:cytochrome P450, partial [Martensiomyces pterosporus]
LPYLGAVISESLRVMSPAPGMLPRLVPAGGARVCGHFLPGGTWVCCAIGAVHMNPSAFPSPGTFDPGRFIGEGGERSANMLAFSTGVRACIGRNLALVEMHVVLANLLRNFDVRL